MDSQPEKPSLTKGEIRFPNDNRAVFVKSTPDVDAADLIKALKIKKPAMVVLLIGGAGDLDASLHSQVERLLGDGLAPAAAIADALIIDGGTQAGVMALMGKVIAERGRVTQLLGIAPDGKVTYPGGPDEGSIPDGAALDPNHSHFVLVEGNEWSSSTEMMFKLVAELAKQSRVVTVLINGGEEAKDEVSRCASQGWPVIVIQGSGRLADEIARQGEVTAQAYVEVNPLHDPEKLRESIVKGVESILMEAWRRFAQYDSRAMSMQRTYAKFLAGAFALGVLGTLFAVTQKQLMTGVSPPYDWIFTASVILLVPVMIVIGIGTFWSEISWRPLVRRGFGAIALIILFWLAIRFGRNAFLAGVIKTLGYFLLVVPFVTSVLATASDRFKPSKKWISLRTCAEAVKKEIFRYRSQVSEYSDSPTNTREQALAGKLATISRRVMRTEASSVSLTYKGPLPPRFSIAADDDGFSILTPERYLELRLGDQLNYYNAKTGKLERRTTFFQWSIMIIGGSGTLLAALGDKLWVAVTSALVTGLTAYIAQLQLDPTLIKYNQSAAELRDLRTWWIALPADAKSANKDKLVEESEKILEGELAGWLQTMAGSKKEEADEDKHK